MKLQRSYAATAIYCLMLLLLVLIGSCSNHHLVSIAITPANASVSQIGQTTQFTATGTTNDTKASPEDLTSSATWGSSTPSIATVDSSGLATATGCGNTTITAKSQGIIGQTQFTVSCTGTTGGGTPVLQSINVYPGSPTIPQVNQTTQFIALGAYLPATTSNNLSGIATWASSDIAVATVNNTGLATAVSCGTTTITAQYQGVLGQTTLTVACTTPATPVLQSITLYPSNPSIPQIGQTTQFIALALYSPASSNNVLTNVATWASSNSTIATVDSNGLATAVACGTTTITAEYQGVVGQMLLTVQCTGSQTLQSITVLPSNPSVAQIGQTSQFAAIGTLVQGGQTDLTNTAVWSSSNPQIATVNSTGLATAVSCGTTNVSAESQSIVGTTLLTVSCSAVESVELIVVMTGTVTGNPPSIISLPAGINCGTVCGALFVEGTGVTLIASPAPSSPWTNCDETSADLTTCYVTLRPIPSGGTSMTITANF